MRPDVQLHRTVVQQVCLELELDVVGIFSSIAAALEHNVFVGLR